MLNLHPPFRRATPDDRQAVAEIAGGRGRITASMRSEPAPEQTVVGEEDGRMFVVLAGGPSKGGEDWQVDLLALAPGRSLEAFAPRLLAIADALAADEGLASVSLTVEAPTHDLRALLDREGFRVAREEGGKISMTRPVVPQG